MPRIAAFRGVRYTEQAGDIEALVAPPFDAIDGRMRSELAGRSEHNIVHVTLPEGTEESRYVGAAGLFGDWRDEGLLKVDEAPSIYVLTASFRLPDGRDVVRNGFIARMRLHDLDERIVIAHERTVPEPVDDRWRLLAAVQANLEPVFLVFSDAGSTARSVMAAAVSTPPITELRTDDGVRQRLHRLTDEDALSALGRAMRPLSVIIADGHHRYMAALAHRDETGKQRPGAHQYVLAYLCPFEDEGLVVRPIHRLLHSVPGLESGDLLEKAGRWFEISMLEVDVRQPEGRASLRASLAEAGAATAAFAMVLPSGDAYLLTLGQEAMPPGMPEEPSLRSLDTSVLHEVLFKEVVGLSPESLEGLDHVEYLESTTGALLRILGAGTPEEGQALFVMNPTPLEQVSAVTAAGARMPQKSTRFFPKVPSGLVFSLLEEEAVSAL